MCVLLTGSRFLRAGFALDTRALFLTHDGGRNVLLILSRCPLAPLSPMRRAAYRIILPLFLLAAAQLLLAAPRAARAQLSRTPQVAVLDFDKAGDPTGGLLSRQATDAVVVEMTRTGRFDVVPRAQLLQQIDALDLPAPLDEIAMRKLGQALGVEYVATGRILGVVEDRRGGARITLAVLMTDVASGVPANGALTVGVADPPSTEAAASDDGGASQATLLRALQNAAFRAVETINRYQLPQATVLAIRDDTVRLNQGSRGGVRVGQEFVIFRGGQRVGHVRVTEVSASDSSARVTDLGRGIRPEDRARAVFTLPALRIESR